MAANQIQERGGVPPPSARRYRGHTHGMTDADAADRRCPARAWEPNDGRADIYRPTPTTSKRMRMDALRHAQARLVPDCPARESTSTRARVRLRADVSGRRVCTGAADTTRVRAKQNATRLSSHVTVSGIMVWGPRLARTLSRRQNTGEKHARLCGSAPTRLGRFGLGRRAACIERVCVHTRRSDVALPFTRDTTSAASGRRGPRFNGSNGSGLFIRPRCCWAPMRTHVCSPVDMDGLICGASQIGMRHTPLTNGPRFVSC